MLRKSLPLGSMFVLLAGPASGQDQGASRFPDPARAARVETYLATLFKVGALSGSVLLARGDTILYQGAFGWADRPGGRKLTVETPIAVASILKPLTSSMSLMLAEQGKLSLGDKVATWFPQFPSADQITVEFLMSHRSGIQHRLSRTGYDYEAQTAASMVPLIAAESLLFVPGTRRVYSSMGYVVLARLLELASGRPYWRLLEDLILAPAGARNSFDATRPGKLPPHAMPYFQGDDGEISRPARNLSFIEGAGSLYSTPADLFAIFSMMDRGGYGSAARERQIRPTVSWTGLTDGYRAVLRRDSTGVVVILATNFVNGSGDWILRDLPRIARGESVTPPAVPNPTVVALRPEAMKALGGSYGFVPGLWTPLEFVSPKAAFAGDYLLLPTSDSTLFSVTDYAVIRAERGTDGRVTGLRWGEGNLVFPRRP
jgi:CubicO group peptidase (beta-lactamase class C family)